MQQIKLKEAIKKYGDREVDIEKLKEILLPQTPKTVWDLETGDSIWYTMASGCIYQTIWMDTQQLNEARKLGNIFLTEKEAKDLLNTKMVETLLQQYSTPIKEFNWRDPHERKYRFYITYVDDIGFELGCTWDSHSILGKYYFKSEEDLQNAKEKIGIERLVNYFKNGIEY